MTTHQLYNWKQYLSDDDYEYLIQFVENIKNNIPNDKMIILHGKERTGKTTLVNNIMSYLGDELCDTFMYPCDVICLENIKKLGFCIEIDKFFKSKKENNAIINLIKYKQSLLTDIINLEKVNNKVLEHSKIIKMEHVF